MGRGISAESRHLMARAYAVLETEHPCGVRRVGCTSCSVTKPTRA